MQFHAFNCQSNQEVLDSIIQAYKVSEKVLLPTMVVLDAFVLSHTMEPVVIPDLEEVRRYLPAFDPPYKLDPEDPHTFGGLAGTDSYFELRYKIQRAMEDSKAIWEETGKEFSRIFGREYGLIETYQMDDAEICIITSSTISSTARVAVNSLREQGRKVGLVRIRVFRPFPAEVLMGSITHVKKALVIDRNISFGASGIFFQEVKAALYNFSERPAIFGFVTGLGGRDVTAADIVEMVETTESMKKPEAPIIFKGLRL